MNMPRPIREITSKVGRAKGQAQRTEGKVNRVRGRFGRRDGAASTSTSKLESEPTTEPRTGRASKPGALVSLVFGMLGAIGAVLLGLVFGDNADDRLLFALIGFPLGAILAIGVVMSYRWAGLIDQPD